tara:strand:+ start:2707 stop:3297 length:591 start_codon:yes stop_codon:yes gene_type:complete
MANLITLTEYKEAKGLQGMKDDPQLNILIESVSQLVKTYCGNSIVDYYSTNKVETFNIDWDSHIVQLSEAPVNTIVSVEERDSYDGSYTTLTTGSYEYYFDSTTDSIIRTTGATNYKHWPKGPAAVKVTYTAGYATCPVDLKLAVIDLITYYHKDEHKQRQTLGGASLQNQGTTSQRGNIAFPDHIKRVLDLYKQY